MISINTDLSFREFLQVPHPIPRDQKVIPETRVTERRSGHKKGRTGMAK